MHEMLALSCGVEPGGPRPAMEAGCGVAAGALARHLVPLRAGDPLGLGGGPRPPPPPDPDAYDRDYENAAFARSLLSPEERRAVDADIDAGGYLTISQARALVAENSTKGSVELAGIDPDLIALLDVRINYKLFVAGDTVFTREELYDNYPFHELNVQPEAIFAQQELGVFLRADGVEYAARDAGDESAEFMSAEELIRGATGKPPAPHCAPKLVKTKIYIGRDRWDDFILLQRLFRGAVRIATAQLAYDRPGGGAPLLALISGMGRGPAPPARTTAAAEPAAAEPAAAEPAAAEPAAAEKTRQPRLDPLYAEWLGRAEVVLQEAKAFHQRMADTLSRLDALVAGRRADQTPSA